jgi:GNAT superfamily N-acetyltransferase
MGARHLRGSVRTVVRPIEPDDVPALMTLIHELAVYEFEPDAVESSEDDLRRALFAEHPQVFAHVAEEEGRVVGAAVWSVSFSTWTGRHGIHLVDLIVGAGARRGGHGASLLRELARICVERGYPRLDWEVLDALERGDADGQPGPHGFYRRHGGAPRRGWTAWRLDAGGLAALAGS